MHSPRSTSRWIHSWWTRKTGPTKPGRVAAPLRTLTLHIEQLEDRAVPAATTLSIADSSIAAPAAGGTADLTFTVTRTGNLSAPLTVGFTTVAGTAVAGTDFTPTTGTTTFAAGSATATIAVPVIGETAYNPQNPPEPTFSVELTGVVGASPFSLSPQTTLGTQSGPVEVAVGDVNGDGLPDVVVANSSAGSVSVFLNTTPAGAATPTFAAPVSFAIGANPTALVLGDINGDGLPDVVTANANGTVSVLLNTTTKGAAPAFATAATFLVGSNPSSVAVGDVNGDGMPDVVTANAGSNTVSVLLNATAKGGTVPAFTSQTLYAVGSHPSAVALGDVNGDGKADLVVANQLGNTVSVLLNIAATGASAPAFSTQQTFAVGSNPTAVAVGDVNGDGKADVVVANGGGNTVSVLLNAAATGATAPAFAAQQTFAVGLDPKSVALTDLDGDGRSDVVVANQLGNSVSVLLNATPTGATAVALAPQLTYAAGANPSSVAAGDLNGDGKPDVVSANLGDNTLSAFLDVPVTAARATATGSITYGALVSVPVVPPPPSPPAPPTVPGAVVVNGTSGPNTLAVSAVPGAGAGTVTYTLNGGTAVTQTGVTSFTYNGQGSDAVAVSLADGPIAPGVVVVNGVPGDSLTVDAAGAAVVTTHGGLVAGQQTIAYSNVSTLNLNNAGTVGALPAPDTADRATALAGLTSNERYIQTLYLADLGRAGSTAELDHWVGQLNGGAGTAAVVRAIETSQEASDHLVRSWYQTFLGRNAQNGEESSAVTALMSGASAVSVLAGILVSNEFYARAQTLIGSGTADQQFVQALYQTLLGRSGDAASVQNMVQAVSVVGRQGVVLGFLNSGEFRSDQVEGLYNVLLNRPSDGGAAGWVSSGGDLTTLVVSFESTSEFVADGMAPPPVTTQSVTAPLPVATQSPPATGTAS